MHGYRDVNQFPLGYALCLGAGLVACAWGTAAGAAGVPAGTIIENRATATFDESGTTRDVASNTVTITVDEVLDLALSATDAGQVALTVDGAILGFEILNSGNGAEAFRLTFETTLAGNAFSPTVVGLAFDTDENGIYDPGLDQLLAADLVTPVLPADGRGRVFVLVDQSAPLPDGATARLVLGVEAATGSGAPGTLLAGQGSGGGDAVVGHNGAVANAEGWLVARSLSVALSKSATVSDPWGGDRVVPGSVVTYAIEASLAGSGEAGDLVVRDPIPAGTTYLAGSLSLDGASLSDATGDDAGAADAGIVAVRLGTVAAGASHVIRFNVIVD